MSVLAPVRLSEAADSLVKASTPEPFSASTTSNWVARAGGLPPYIQHIAHDLMEKRGKTESEAIGMAVGICQNWASGRGKVDANTQAAARKAIAEWEAKKAKAAADKAGKAASKAGGKLGEARIGLSERVALRTAASARLRVIEDALGVDSMVALLEAKGAGFKPELKRVASASREKERYELHDAGQHVGTIASRTAYDPTKADRWRASAVNGRQIGEETDSQGKAMDAVRKHLEDAPARVVASPTAGRFLVGEPQSYSGTTNYKEFPSESSARFEAGLPEKPTSMEKTADVNALGEMIAFDVFTLNGLGEELPTGLTFLSEAVVLAEDFHGFDPAKHPRGVHGRFAIGDKVNFQHSYFGRVPASVTKVTSRRVFISSSDPRVKPTSMTHNQAAAKLSKTTGAAKKSDAASAKASGAFRMEKRGDTVRHYAPNGDLIGISRPSGSSVASERVTAEHNANFWLKHTKHSDHAGAHNFLVRKYKAGGKKGDVLGGPTLWGDKKPSWIKEGEHHGGTLGAMLDARMAEAELTTKARAKLPPEDFVYPDKAPGPGSYPIGDRKHAIDALARAADPANSGDEATVKAKVYARYPDLKPGGKGAK